MIDIHAHFADEGYTFPEEWEKIKAAGVQKVVLAGDTIEHSKWHRDFCKAHDGAYFCAGIHPETARDLTETEFDELFELCKDEKCVAVGEIGLDYHYPDFNKKNQRDTFVTQILMAEGAGLPVQIHSRDACADTLAILHEMKEHLKGGFLLHCYSYGQEVMDEFLSLGAYFSFGGVTCFKNAKKVVEAVAHCPIDRILSETDSPYLSPVRGEKNTPANIPVIVEKIAQIKGMEFAEVYEAIRENAARLFPKLK
ncbi:MAG: TatD family hydrolase [Clostridia bacterium]|nr:TatD family hydrolase [Clostridia bacterium]